MDAFAGFWNFQEKDVAKNMQANYIDLIKIGHRDLHTSTDPDLISPH